MKTFKLPDLGEGLPDAEIVRWLVAEGDTVKLDQPMVEMETAKAVVEVPSPFTGTIVKLHGQPGDVIQTGAPLVDIDDGSDAEAAIPAEGPKFQEAAASVQPAASASQSGGSTSGNSSVFHLPDLGEGLPEAEIVRWLVATGDTVKQDQPMVEMETAKAVVEVPAPQSGVIAELHGQPGDIIKTGAPLVTFGSIGDKGASTVSEAPVEAEETKREDAGTVVGSVQVGNTIASESEHQVAGKTVTPVIRALAKKLKVDLAEVTGSGPGGRITQADVRAAASNKPGSDKKATVSQPRAAVSSATDDPLRYKASPAVRALANRLGVSLAACSPTGKKGSITRDDVRRAAGSGAQPKPQVRQDAGLPNVSVTASPEPVRGARRAMANAMTASHASVVPVTLMDDADISAWPKGTDATARMLRAIARAAAVEPALNAWFDGERMERLVHPTVNVGIAVDTPEGLYVPVLTHAERRDLSGLRQELDTLIGKVRDKSIKPQEMQGASISLSNFGTIAGRYGTPIVVPPQVAILGAGRYREDLRLTERGISKCRMLPLSLSFDHRACTGGEGARFLAAVIADLQLPQ
jgi:pyruvate dehydrogenase E2 component (dihydrolipoamide acetyltransferase)